MREIMHSFEKFNTDYYNVLVTTTQRDSGDWYGEVMITRNDTGEESPGGFAANGLTREKVENEIYGKMEGKLKYLSKPPVDWNKSSKKILARYIRSRWPVIGFGVKLGDLEGESKGDDENSLMGHFGRICSDLVSDTIEIVREIDGLTSREREELLFSRDNVYNDPFDPWNQEDLVARSQIFGFFLKPSAKEIEIHELHNKRTEDAFNE